MKKVLEDNLEFQKAFGQPVIEAPALIPKDLAMLRFELMREENEEYLEAVQNNDLVEVADALGDQLYILCGTILSHGMQHIIEKLYAEIHRSNMSKLGADGKPIYREDGKVLKGPSYSKPDLKPIVYGDK